MTHDECVCVYLCVSQEMYSRCDERCVISVQSRSHCKHCRLLKCFGVGMRAELILSTYNNLVITPSYRTPNRHIAWTHNAQTLL